MSRQGSATPPMNGKRLIDKLRACIGGVKMIAAKGKRKLFFRGMNYYWHIKKNSDGIPQILISSEDKSLFLRFFYDVEMIIGPQEIRALLSKYADKADKNSIHAK